MCENVLSTLVLEQGSAVIHQIAVAVSDTRHWRFWRGFFVRDKAEEKTAHVVNFTQVICLLSSWVVFFFSFPDRHLTKMFCLYVRLHQSCSFVPFRYASAHYLRRQTSAFNFFNFSFVISCWIEAQLMAGVIVCKITETLSGFHSWRSGCLFPCVFIWLVFLVSPKHSQICYLDFFKTLIAMQARPFDMTHIQIHEEN